MRAPVPVQQAFQYGLIIFTLTALIGLASGGLDRATVSAHVHSGTLGWITMGVIGIAIWIFGRANEDLFAPVLLSALTMAAYVMAFWSEDFILQAVFGLAALAVLVYWWWFVYERVQERGGVGRLEVSKLSVLFGLTTLVVGSIGVLFQLLSESTSAPSFAGHAAGESGGYFVLVAAGFIEWQITGNAMRTKLAVAQLYVLFVGALLLSASLILDVVVGQPSQFVAVLATLLIVAGIGILAFRVGSVALATPWMAKTGARHIAIAVAFLLLAAILQAVVVQQLMAVQGDVSLVPAGLLAALDHSYFVGVMTNLIFGAILVTTSDAGIAISKRPVRPRAWPWADDIIFWALNIGAAAFIAVLVIVGSGRGHPAFTHPASFAALVMGLSALLGVATYLTRMVGTPAFLSRRARA